MKNVMFIVIAIMSLTFVSNAFGQAADWEIKPAVRKPANAVKKPKQVQTVNNGRTMSSRRNSGKLTKTRKPTVRQMQENNSTYQQRRRQPNPKAKRQHLPCRGSKQDCK